MPRLNDKITADLGKLHAEVNQFRNQEFWVCSFALALFGATAKELPGKTFLSLAILLLLAGLFLWHYTLVATRARLITYMRYRGLSPWEDCYRQFANKLHRPSQRTAALTIFVALGFLTPISAAWPLLEQIYRAKNLDDAGGLWWYVIPGAAYQLIVWIFGTRDYQDKLARYMQVWRQEFPELEQDQAAQGDA